METTIKLLDCRPVLTGRSSAKEFIENNNNLTKDIKKITIDCSGVVVLSQAFANEIFITLFQETNIDPKNIVLSGDNERICEILKKEKSRLLPLKDEL